MVRKWKDLNKQKNKWTLSTNKNKEEESEEKKKKTWDHLTFTDNQKFENFRRNIIGICLPEYFEFRYEFIYLPVRYVWNNTENGVRWRKK